MLNDLSDGVRAIVTIVACALAGQILGLLVSTILRSLASKRSWTIAGHTAQSLKGMPLVWGALAGVALARPLPALAQRTDRILGTTALVLSIATVTWFAARITGRLVREATARDDVAVPSGSIFVNLARLAVIIMGALVGLKALNIEIAPLLTALGVGGLAVALALQDTLSNLFAGLQVVLSKQIKPGDFIRLDTGQEGWVHDVTWRNTTVRLQSNDLVIVPNATIGKSPVTNFTSMDEQHTVVVPFTVTHGSDLDLVERLALDVAREVIAEVPGTVADHEPKVWFVSAGETGVLVKATMRVSSYDHRQAAMSAFVKALSMRFAKEGVEFAQYTRNMRL